MTHVPLRAGWARLPREIEDQIFQFLLYLPFMDPQLAHTSPYYATYYYSYTGTASRALLRYMLVCRSWRASVEDVVIKSNDVAHILGALPEPLCRKALQRFFSRTHGSSAATPAAGRLVQRITARGLVSCTSTLIEGYNRRFAGLCLPNTGEIDPVTEAQLLFEQRDLSRAYQRHLADAIQSAQPEMVRLLVQAGATPCHINSPLTPHDLLQYLASPNLLPGYPRDPTPEEKVHHERKVGGPRRIDILRVLLDGIGHVDGSRYRRWDHPLCLAFKSREFEAAKVLLQYGVVVNDAAIMAHIKKTYPVTDSDPEMKRLFEELDRT